MHRELPGIDPREVEEIGGEPREPLNLPLHRFDEAAAGLIVEVLVREELQKATDREQRCTQLMGGVRDELLARVVELRELNAHPVERARELADLVVAVIHDRRAEVAASDPLGRVSSASRRCESIPAAVRPRISASTSANAVARSRRSRTICTVASESASGAWKSTTVSGLTGTATSA